MTRVERAQRTKALIADLRSQHLPAYDRKLELFHELGRSHLGIAVAFTPELAFRFLACHLLYVRFRCSSRKCNYTYRHPWQFCGMRFLCEDCAAWSHRVQAECWKNGIRRILADGNGRVLDQLLELEWDLPWSHPDHLHDFNRFLTNIVKPRLNRSYPGNWFMATAHDPVRGEARAVLGITAPKRGSTCFNADYRTDEASSCFNAGRGASSCFSGSSRVTETSRWKPKTIRSVERSTLDRSLEWLAGNAQSLMGLAPRRAIELEWKYYGRRLYASRGLLYGRGRKAGHAADIQIGRDSLPPIHRPGELLVCPCCGTRLSMSFEHHFQRHRNAR